MSVTCKNAERKVRKNNTYVNISLITACESNHSKRRLVALIKGYCKL